MDNLNAKYRFNLISIEKDDDSLDLEKNIIFRANEIHEINAYMANNYISSTKQLYIVDRYEQTISGITKKL
jgi:hypothetical protein